MKISVIGTPNALYIFVTHKHTHNLPTTGKLIMKIQDLTNNAKLDSAAMDDIAGGLRFVWKRVRRVRCIFGVKVIYYVWKLVAVYI